MKKSEAGLLALVVGNQGVDLDKLSEALETQGHIALRAGDAARSIAVLSQYPIDLVVVPSGAGACTSETLQTLAAELTETARLVILRSDLNEKQCEQHSSGSVFYLPCRPGQENALAAALNDLLRETSRGLTCPQ